MRCEARTPRRHPRARRQRPRRRAQVRRRRPRSPRSTSRSTAPSPSPRCAPWSSPPLAEAMRRMHPLRLSYEFFGPRNPWLAWVDAAAERVRATRRPSEAGNPLLAAQAALSQQIVDGFEAYRRSVERLSEDTFHAVYGTPALQAALGIDTESTQPPRKAPRSELHKALVERRTEQLRAAMTAGRPARGAGPRAPLGRHGPPRRRRARLRGDHPPARRPRGQPADDARRVQGAGPRPVPDADDRRGGGARRHPGAPARRRRRAPRRPSPSSAASSRRAAPPATPRRPGSSASPPSSASARSW